MSALIDTNIAIHLRDGDPHILELYAALDAPPALSIISRVELEGGVVARPEFAERRRAALDALTTELDVLDFDEAAAHAYRGIVEAAGYVRARILDRMIAATALSRGLSLITINHADFRDIPGLDLIAWNRGQPKHSRHAELVSASMFGRGEACNQKGRGPSRQSRAVGRARLDPPAAPPAGRAPSPQASLRAVTRRLR